MRSQGYASGRKAMQSREAAETAVHPSRLKTGRDGCGDPSTTQEAFRSVPRWAEVTRCYLAGVTIVAPTGTTCGTGLREPVLTVSEHRAEAAGSEVLLASAALSGGTDVPQSATTAGNQLVWWS